MGMTSTPAALVVGICDQCGLRVEAVTAPSAAQLPGWYSGSLQHLDDEGRARTASAVLCSPECLTAWVEVWVDAAPKPSPARSRKRGKAD